MARPWTASRKSEIPSDGSRLSSTVLDANPERFHHEASRRIDRAARPNRDEEIATAQRVINALHVVGHFAENQTTSGRIFPGVAQLTHENSKVISSVPACFRVPQLAQSAPSISPCM